MRESIKLLQGEAKKRQSQLPFTARGRTDLADKEQSELAIIEEYLPKQLTDVEIETIIAEVKSANPNGDFGTLMKTVMVKVAGRADGGKVAKLLQTG